MKHTIYEKKGHLDRQRRKTKVAESMKESQKRATSPSKGFPSSGSPATGAQAQAAAAAATTTTTAAAMANNGNANNAGSSNRDLNDDELDLDAALVTTAPIQFIRVDPGREWLRTVMIRQTEEMWLHQLLDKEKDVTKQLEALRGLNLSPWGVCHCRVCCHSLSLCSFSLNHGCACALEGLVCD